MEEENKEVISEETKEVAEETVNENPTEETEKVITWENEDKKNKKSAPVKIIILAAVLVVCLIGLIVSLVMQNADKKAKEEALLAEVSGNDTTSETSASEDSSDSLTTILTIDNVDDYVVSFGQYKGLTVEDVEMEEVTDDEVDYYAEYFFSSEVGVVDGRVAEEGDTVVIDYVGTVDGVAFEGGTASDQELELGSDSYIDGFEDGLIGSVAGETRELNLTFPETYGNEDLAGKDCVFTVTVTGVKPGLCDEGVASLGSSDYTTVEEYKANIADELYDYKYSQYYDSYVYAVLELIMANSEFNISEDLMDEQREAVNTTYSDYASYYGYDVESYLAAMGTSVDEIAESYAKQMVIFYKVAKEEGLYTEGTDATEMETEIINNVYDFLFEQNQTE